MRRAAAAILLAALVAACSESEPLALQAATRMRVGPPFGRPPVTVRQAAGLVPHYVQLATDWSSLQAVIDQLGLEETPEQLRARVIVHGDETKLVITIGVADSVEQRARAIAIANGLASQLLATAGGRDFCGARPECQLTVIEWASP